MDGRVFRSVRKLFLAPGFLTREQFEGRRAPWLSPVRLYLIFSVAYFALMSIAGTGLNVRIDSSDPEDRARACGGSAFRVKTRCARRSAARWPPGCRASCSCSCRCSRRSCTSCGGASGYTYPQHLLFALHVHAACVRRGGGPGADQASRCPASWATKADEASSSSPGRIYLVKAFRVAYGGTTGQAILQTIIRHADLRHRPHSRHRRHRRSDHPRPEQPPTEQWRRLKSTEPSDDRSRRLASSQRSPADQWPAYGGDAGGTRYSALTQVTPANVKGLQVAWTYRTGELGENAESGESLTFEATPIHFDGRLYLSTSFGKVIALDPATGREVWTYDAKISRTMDYSEVTSRGVSSWRDSRASDDADAANAPCAARIFLGTIDARLIALDAKTGQPCAGFGANGIVNLKTGVHTPSTEGDYQVTSPPAILGDHVIVGSSIGDNWNVDTGSGIVRSFDARTGALRWSWQPVARENAKGGQVGAANAWSMISVDAARDLVFVPTTSPSPDFFGGLRPGANADANSVVALRGSTGERVWAFQTVHHDLWDYDIAAQPALVTVTHDGRQIPAVAQATKMGSIFLLDRLTGTPIWPVEERPVPKTDIAGETSSPTQPFTMKPRSLMPIGPITPETVWGLNDKDRAECRALAAQYRSEGIFTPPSLRGTIM